MLILGCQGSFAESAKVQEYPTAATTNASTSNIEVNLYLLRDQELESAKLSLSKNLTDEERKTSLKNILLQKNRDIISAFPKGVVSHFTRTSAEEVRRSILSHPVVGDEALIKYDPHRKIGFCFGRATYVHLELLRRGVPPQNIGKIFAIGKLYNGYSGWDYHVSTVVKINTDEWIAIDGLAPSTLSIPEWMEVVSRWSADPTEIPPRFYFTDAVKFQPTPGAYDKDRLGLPIYKGYFSDLIGGFKALN